MDIENFPDFEEETIDEDDKFLDFQAKNTVIEDEFMRFMNKNRTGKPKTISELIAEKIQEKRDQLNNELDQDSDKRIEPKVLSLYKEVGVVLSKFTSGKLPKAFKIIPSLSNWEQLLKITKPEKWSSAAMYEATRLFVANLKEPQVQRFLNKILLPRVRDDILSGKKLNLHLYKSLQKSLYKPGAFFKGIVIPLCESGDCTHKEAVIVGSILAKNSIPLLHSCAAILRIAELEYTGANSLFMNFLIQKKYALPFRVIDALVFHFIRVSNDTRQLPSLWHKCFLGFVEFYKKDISQEQKEALLETFSSQSNPAYTPKISKHLKEQVDQELVEESSINNYDNVKMSDEEMNE